MRIRKATTKDFDTYLKLFKLGRVNYPEIFSNSSLLELVSLKKNYKQELEKEFKSYLFSKNKILLFAEDNKIIVGFIAGSIAKFPLYYLSNIEGHIDSLLIIKDYQGKRISSLLKEGLFDWFKSKKLNYVGLHVMENNFKAQKIYNKWGFKFFSRRMKLKL